MQDVFRMSCGPRNSAANGEPERRRGFGARARPPMYVVHALAAVFVCALVVHLLMELAVLADPSDLTDLLTAAGGMVVVLFIMGPFAVVFAERAHRDWTRGTKPAPAGRGGAVPF